jgi:NAD+ diphosphatase
VDCTFTGHALDRGDPQRNDPQWIAERIRAPGSLFIPYSKTRPALTTGGERLEPRWVDRDWLGSALQSEPAPVLLGVDAAGTAYFAIDVGDRDPPEGAKFIDVRSAASQIAATGGPVPDIALVGLARSLLEWNSRHRFCSTCGKPSTSAKGGYSRQCTDPACGSSHFARVDPVVIMLATDGDRCALGRQARFPPRMYSALAGFVEPGESIEEAVIRETREESNLEVTDVRYVASQPWPFPSSLMIGCIARAVSFDIEPDREELEDVRWFSRDDVRGFFAGEKKDFFLPPPMAIAHQLIKTWASATGS